MAVNKTVCGTKIYSVTLVDIEYLFLQRKVFYFLNWFATI